MTINTHDITSTLQSAANGNLEIRLTHIDKNDNYDIGWGINNLLDKVEAFMRESLYAMEEHTKGNDQWLIDPRGFQGTFSSTLNMFNKAIIENTELKKQQQEMHNELQSLLDSLGQGFMLCTPEGKIKNGCSQIASEFFNGSPAGKLLSEVLQMNEEESQELQKWLNIAFEEMLPFDDLKDFAPREFTKNRHRYIELDYRPIRDNNGTITSIIVIATDKSEERRLAAKLEEEQALAEIMMTIIKDRPSFIEFVRESRTILEQLKIMLQANPREVDINAVFRLMHSLKGGAASFKFTLMKNLAHEFETQLEDLKTEDRHMFIRFIPQLKNGVLDISLALENFLDKHNDLIGDLGQNECAERSLPVEQLIDFANNMQEQLGEQSPVYKNFVGTFILQNIDSSFVRFERVVNDVAQKQNKEVQLQIQPSPIKVRTAPYKALLTSLVHAFRNAVDHGLEEQEERLNQNKNRTGKIDVSFNRIKGQKQDQLKVVIADDGRGIDPDFIAAKAIEKGLLTQNCIDKLSDPGKLQLIMAAGFSSKEEVSDISGRGVGLDAVKHEVEQLGGKVWIESEISKGTKLNMELPLVETI